MESVNRLQGCLDGLPSWQVSATDSALNFPLPWILGFSRINVMCCPFKVWAQSVLTDALCPSLSNQDHTKRLKVSTIDTKEF